MRNLINHCRPVLTGGLFAAVLLGLAASSRAAEITRAAVDSSIVE